MGDIPEPEPDEPEDMAWLATYGDMVTLLLVFFVLLVSMSTVEVKRFQSVFGSMRMAFGGLSASEIAGGQMQSNIDSNTQQSVQDLMRIRQELLKNQENVFNAIQSYLSKKNVEGDVGAVLDEGTITLTIGDSLLFAPGSEELSEGAEEQLETILEIIEANREMTVNIKGYTDDSTIPEGARFKNNWELSALRAVNVLRWLIDHGIDPLRITATGMGDLNPRFPNDSPENKAKNRRVEFCLERQVVK